MNEREIFLAVLEIDAAQKRQAFLQQACGKDDDLRQRVEALLKSHDEIQPEGNEGTEAYTPVEGESIAPSTSYSKDLKGVVIGGKYKLRQHLGIGGMGEVWAAEQTEPVRRHVAVKLIKSGMDSATITARFEQERQALAMMDHPNIARVLDAGTTDDRRPYFVMELVKGIPITKYCDQEHLSPRERLELFLPVCQAVQHAHQKGIIHRDLKPSNILIALYDGKPVPKVIDFGVAKATHQKLIDQTMFTEIGAIIGTLEYMAPEQAELNNLDIDTRADIYSLGVILYEMLAGSPPFSSKQLRGAAFSEMIRLIREVEPPKPSTKLSSSEELPNIAANRKLEPKRLRNVVAGDLDWIVMKALEKDRNRRYETSNGLAMDLQRYLADEPVLAGPPSVTYLLKKYIIRNKGLVTAAAIILLSLFIGILGTTWGWYEARHQRDEAENARTNEAEQRKQAEEQRDRATAAEKLAKTERDRATQEAARATAFNSFMEQLFLSVNPETRGSREATVLELVQKASGKADKTLANQPQVEAAVRTFLGNTLSVLGKIDEATRELEKAVSLRSSGVDANTFVHCESLRALGVTLAKKGDYRGALAAHQKALAILSPMGDHHLKELSTQYLDIARTQIKLSQYSQAEQSLRQSEDVLNRLPHVSPESQGSLCGLKASLAESWKGDLELSEKLNTEALSYMRQANNETLIPDALNSLGIVKMLRGKPEEAIPLYEEAIAIYRRVYGDIHPLLAISIENLANAWFRKKDYDQASKLLEQVASLRDTLFGAGSFPAARTRFNMGMILSNQGNPQKAIETFDQVLPVFRKHVGNKSIEVATVLRNRGYCQMKLKQYDAALRDYQSALEILDTIGKPSLDQRIHTLLNMTQVYRLQGKEESANETMKLALTVLDHKKPDQEKWIKKFEELPASGKVEEKKP